MIEFDDVRILSGDSVDLFGDQKCQRCRSRARSSRRREQPPRPLLVSPDLFDMFARELAANNIRLAYAAAKRFRQYLSQSQISACGGEEEIEAELMLTLFACAKMFNAGRGHKFSTFYFTCAKNAIAGLLSRRQTQEWMQTRSFVESSGAERGVAIDPRDIAMAKKMVRRLPRRLHRRIGFMMLRCATIAEMAVRLRVSTTTVRRHVKVVQHALMFGDVIDPKIKKKRSRRKT